MERNDLSSPVVPLLDPRSKGAVRKSCAKLKKPSIMESSAGVKILWTQKELVAFIFLLALYFTKWPVERIVQRGFRGFMSSTFTFSILSEFENSRFCLSSLTHRVGLVFSSLCLLAMCSLPSSSPESLLFFFLCLILFSLSLSSVRIRQLFVYCIFIIICSLFGFFLRALSLSSWYFRFLFCLSAQSFIIESHADQSKTDPGSSYATPCWDALPNEVQRDVISKLPPESQMCLRLTSKKMLTLTRTDYHPYCPISDLPLVVNLVTLFLFMKPRVKVFETLSLLRKKSRTDNMEAKYLQVFATSARECFSRGVKYIYSFTGEKVEKMIAQGGVVDDADPDIVSAPPMNEETHDSSVWMEYISSPKEQQEN